MMDTDRTRRRETWHRIKGYLAVAVSLAVLVGGGYAVFDVVESRVTGFFTAAAAEDYEGNGAEDIEIEVPQGASVTDIGHILHDNDVIASTEAWQAAVASDPEASTIQAGTYAMKTRLPAATALEYLLDTDRLQVTRVTVPEGLVLSQQVEALAKSGIPAKDFEKALKRPDDLDLVPYAEGSPEGFLFPDTYEFDDDTTAGDLLRQMAGRYDDVAEDLDFEGAAQELGLTPRDIAIVASIIDKEVTIAEDRPKVARVIYNRLEQGMRLQFDSTVYYATGVYPPEQQPAGAFEPSGPPESPYNTYKVDGLPAGPISAPGRAAMEAAARPSDGDWLYFVTVNFDTGETRFTADPAEHERNVQEWRDWCEANDNPSGC
ncbi:endolytic transglycosylase MltG [Auraticoccus sp. F435]|uniref:Endolytic murein transglycosylase n=1 Tax=Auraticoccus cholistanensis TaxID=2656650 RepID=A0A6A9UW64_9ACTN|nr:endolytic transglycosylase MltG [Auraticoccus cholistanensis]MVA75935.1 endolytic transglycosylase MltG [Auraticoccus cholistanensis]